jgi:PAS domain S-box-containing protein
MTNFSMTGFSADISKEALRKRLEWQELMSALSMNFVSTENMTALIHNALRMMGEFLEVERIVICVPDYREGLIRPAYAWRRTENTHPKPANPDIGALIARSFPKTASPRENVPCIRCDDVGASEKYAVLRTVEIKSFIWAPLYVSGKIWGILSVEECGAARAWSENDLQLVNHVSSVITGAAAKNAVEEKLLRMSSIVEHSPHYICHVGVDGKVEYVNEGASRMTGFSNDELMGGGLEILFDGEVLTQLREQFAPGFPEEAREELTAPLRCKWGRPKILNLSVFPVGKKSVGIIGSDVTEKAKLQRELLKAKERAENSNNAKSEFLSRMSHEMRTPMNAIIGMASIGRTAVGMERKDYCLDKIGEASKHLLGVINDILDMSKIEAGKFTISLSEFKLERALHGATNVVGFRMDEKKIGFRLDLANELPAFIVSDEQRLTQVLANLLSNAVKFTPENGSIALSARLIEDNGDICTLEFDVTDTGIGISEESLPKLFNSFEQADSGISRKYGGTGLGLAISKRIVELLGGKIWVKSEEGQGSSFTFQIVAMHGVGKEKEEKAEKPENTGAPGSHSGCFKDFQVLLAEDVDINREILCGLLEDTGVAIDIAQNGLEAVKAFEKDPEKYSLILMDIHMPEMDGYQATRAIRGLSVPRAKEVPIVAMTANVFREDVERCLDAGMNDHLGKPIDMEDVMAKLFKYLRVCEKQGDSI